MLWLWMGVATAAPLTLDHVLDAVDPRIPALAASWAELEQAEAELLAARAGNEPVLTGAWSPGDPSLTLTQPTVLGPSVALGWDGTTPSATLSVPVLDGLIWNSARAALVDARLSVSVSEADVALTELQVRGKAARAWWAWVAAGARLELADEQLALARSRDDALTIAVVAGQRPRLDQVDNQTALLSRESSQLKAAQDLALAAVGLSLWYRDGDGAPLVPTRDQLPDLVVTAPTDLDLDLDRQRARTRPDVVALDLSIQLAQAELKHAWGKALPTLDVTLTTTPQEVTPGVAIEVPLLLRAERGGVQATQAKLTRLAAVQQGYLDQIDAELEQAHVRALTSWERALLARQAVDANAEALRLERAAFDLGGSEVFRLVQREQKLASAEADRISAELTYALADLDRRMANGQGP